MSSVHCFDGLTDGDPKPIGLLWVHSVTTVYEKTSLILFFFFFSLCECISVRRPVSQWTKRISCGDKPVRPRFLRTFNHLGLWLWLVFYCEYFRCAILCVFFSLVKLSLSRPFVFCVGLSGCVYLIRRWYLWLYKHFVTLRLHSERAKGTDHNRRRPCRCLGLAAQRRYILHLVDIFFIDKITDDRPQLRP